MGHMGDPFASRVSLFVLMFRRPTVILSFDGNNDRSNVYATTVAVEVNATLNEGEDREVTTHADIETRVPLGATLTDDDVAGDDDLIAEFFDAETLAA